MEKMKKVLIADDDKYMRDDLTSFLSGYFQVTIASDGYKAIRALIAEPFDVLLLDLNLPQLCGENVFRVLKTMNTQTLTYVITGDTDADTEKRVRAMGVAGFFTKPVEKKLLLQAVQAGLKYRDELSVKITAGGRK